MDYVHAWGIGLPFFAAQIFVVYKAAVALTGVEADWLNWVRDKSHERFTREEMFQQLDQLTLNNGWRLMLRRLGVIAPLIGVVITAIGFQNINELQETSAPIDELSYSEIMRGLSPLYGGVLAGAILAIINQFLMQYLDHLAVQLRSRCEAHRTVDGADPVNAALQTLSQVITDIAEAARTQLQQAVTEAEAQMHGVARSVQSAAEIIDSIRNAGDDIYREVGPALSEAVTAFSQAAEECGKNAKDFAAVGQTLEKSAASVQSGAQNLAASSGAINSQLDSLNSEIKKLSEAVAQQNANTQLDRLSSEITRLSESMAQRSDRGENVSGELTDVIRSLTEAVHQMRQDSMEIVLEEADESTPYF